MGFSNGPDCDAELLRVVHAKPNMCCAPCEKEVAICVRVCTCFAVKVSFAMLKFMFARLFLDVNVQVTVLTHNYHFGHRYGRFLSFWTQIRSLLVPRTCHLVGWVLHIGALGDHGPIQGHLGAEERRPWDPGLDFYRFWVDFDTPF